MESSSFGEIKKDNQWKEKIRKFSYKVFINNVGKIKRIFQSLENRNPLNTVDTSHHGFPLYLDEVNVSVCGGGGAYTCVYVHVCVVRNVAFYF